MARTGTASGKKTPGSVLKEQFIDKLGLSVNGVATSIGENPSTIRNVIDGKKFSVELAELFAKLFGTTVDYWIDLNVKSKRAKLKENADFQARLKSIKKISAAKKGPAAASKPGRKPKAAAEKAPTGAKRGRKPRALSPASVL